MKKMAMTIDRRWHRELLGVPQTFLEIFQNFHPSRVRESNRRALGVFRIDQALYYNCSGRVGEYASTRRVRVQANTLMFKGEKGTTSGGCDGCAMTLL